MKSKKPIINFIIINVLNICAVSLMVFLYLSIRSQTETLSQMPKDLITAENKKQNAKFLLSQKEELAAELSKIDSVYLDQDSVLPFIENMEKVASDLGLTLKFESVEVAQKKSEETVFFFAVNGGFAEIFNFIKLIENYPQQIVFREVSFNKPNDMWNARFKITIASFLASN